MARVVVPVTAVTREGVAPAAEVAGDATNHHYFANSGRVVLLVRNSHATVAKTVTIITPGTVDGQAVADRVISVPATVSRYIGPFPTAIYNDTSDLVNVDVESTDIKLSAYGF